MKQNDTFASAHQVYLNLNEMMLPFDGLLNLLENGFDLFFFSSYKALLDLRMASFCEYLEVNVGKKQADFFWENKIFSFEKSKPPRGALTLTRSHSLLLKASQGDKVQMYCVVPRPKTRPKGSLIGEFPQESEGCESFFIFLAKAFFDELLFPKDSQEEALYPCLVLHRLVLCEVEFMSHYFGENYETILEPLKFKGLFLSLSKKNSRLVKNLLSSDDISRWLFDYFLISRDKKKEDGPSQRNIFNKEYVFLRFQVLLSVLMILLVKKGAFSSFDDSEDYLRRLFFVGEQVVPFQEFLEDLGEDKFNYLVWQFFPEYLGSVSYFHRGQHALQDTTSHLHKGEEEQPLSWD